MLVSSVALFLRSSPPAANALAASRASAFCHPHSGQCVAHPPTAARARRSRCKRAHVALSAKHTSSANDFDGSGGDDHISADLNMEVLRRRMQRYGGGFASGSGGFGGASPYAPEDLASCADLEEGTHLDELESGWVLLFAPNSDEEGVYTVQDDDEITFVLAFEDREDATRFAQQLQAEDFDLPSVCQWSMDLLTEFCEEGDFKIGLVPEGVSARAPRAARTFKFAGTPHTRGACARADHGRTPLCGQTARAHRRSCSCRLAKIRTRATTCRGSGRGLMAWISVQMQRSPRSSRGSTISLRRRVAGPLTQATSSGPTTNCPLRRSRWSLWLSSKLGTLVSCLSSRKCRRSVR